MKKLCSASVNLLLMVASICFVVFLIEGWARLTGRYVDEDKARIRAEERLYYLKDLILGWRGKPNASYTMVGTEVRTIVRNNSIGFGDKEFIKEKRLGVTRIVVLGDSFIWGYGTELVSNRFTNLLEKILREKGTAVEVYIFGLSGWGNGQRSIWLTGISSLPIVLTS